MELRAALALLFALVAAPLAAQENKPKPVAVGPVTLEIVARSDTEQELRHGARVLAKDYRIEAGPVVKAGAVHIALFDL